MNQVMIRATLIICVSVSLLAACVPAQKLQRTEGEMAKFNTQLGEARSNAACNQNAMPGTPEHLACRLAQSNAGK